MLRKTIVLLTLFMLPSAAFAGTRTSGGSVDLLSKTVSDGPHPSVFLYTNSPVYLAGSEDIGAIEARVSIDANGNSAPRAFFLYLRNQATGETRYIDTTGLRAAGEVRAIDGSGPDTFTATDVTDVSDLVLLGAGGLVGGAIDASDLAVGTYRLVLDLRELSGQRTVVFSTFGFSVVNEVVEVTSDISNTVNWTSDKAYFLNDRAVFVNNGGVLNIAPGTTVLGVGQNSALVVARGGKIFARGTAARPIVMTSANPVGQRDRGDWGGLILNGKAPINTGEQEGEGGTGPFGGNDPNDSSGELRYVRVEFAGIEFSPDNELNGIAFQGVGAGTIVDYVQVLKNQDDGVEFFGGTVNAKHILLTWNADDSLDWVLGWVGKVQFVCAQQWGEGADNGIEADNLAGNNDLAPISNPTIYNATFIGDPSTDPDRSESDLGVLLREGTAATLRNFIVMGFKESAVDVDHTATVNRINAGLLTFSNSLFFNNCVASGPGIDCTGPNGADQFAIDALKPLAGFSTKAWMSGNVTNRSTLDPKLRDGYSLIQPDFRPELNSPALDLRYVATPPDDGFFDAGVDYLGCMSPTEDWTRGWTYVGPF